MTKNIHCNNLIWKSEYNIGNLKIDNEHKKLFLIARRALFLKDTNPERQKENLRKILNELFKYVKEHFSNEEEYMKEIKYPNIKKHKRLHKKMILMLRDLLYRFPQLQIEQIEVILFKFLNEYFVKHIIIEDKKIHLSQVPLNELRYNFGWRDKYSVGNVDIDREHKHLFDIAKDALEIVNPRERTMKLKEIIKNLYDYMKTHFEHEEKYMEEVDYPQIKAHKKLHAQIILSLNEFILEIPELNTERFEKELASLIEIALVQHILLEDRKIMDWAIQNGLQTHF